MQALYARQWVLFRAEAQFKTCPALNAARRHKPRTPLIQARETIIF
jgi:hypothetical protein